MKQKGKGKQHKANSGKRRARSGGSGGSGRLLIIVIALIVVFMLLLGGTLYYFLVYKPAHDRGKVVGGKREAEALQGSLNILTEEEIQAELNRVVEEGMFRISIASTVVCFGDGAEVRIQNHFTNRYVMQVDVILDDTRELIYSTDLIDPGYYIQEAVLDVPLAAGEYDATAIFTALYADTEEIVGTAGAQIKLIVFPPGTTPPPPITPAPDASPSPSPEV